jgi:hypothetical protein
MNNDFEELRDAAGIFFMLVCHKLKIDMLVEWICVQIRRLKKE